MKSTQAIAALALMVAASAQAAPVTVNYAIQDAGGGTLVDGWFSYDSALNGSVLSYADLTGFNLHFTGSGSTYGLAFVNSGGFQTPYLHFEFDTAATAFNFATTNLAGSPLAAIKAGYLNGFWIGDNGAVGDYASGGPVNMGTSANVTYRVTTQDVPEPASLALAAVALAGGWAARRRRG